MSRSVAKINSGRGSRGNRCNESTKSAFADYLQPTKVGFVIVAATLVARQGIFATEQLDQYL